MDRELHHRHDKRLAALLKRARLKYPQACIEDVQAGNPASTRTSTAPGTLDRTTLVQTGCTMPRMTRIVS
ncbi:hypothetical protein D3C71_2008900 [compost metagenome]